MAEAIATTRDAELGQKRPMKHPTRPNSSVLGSLDALSTRLAAQGCVAPPRRPYWVDSSSCLALNHDSGRQMTTVFFSEP